MDSVDTSWCPVCSRQILPKRYLVPVYPANTVTPTNATTPTPSAILPASTQATAPAPPPSSPSSSSSDRSAKPASKARHTRTVARPRGGLARGTGRVRPNGSIKRADSKKDVAVVAAPAPAKVEKPALQPAPIRHRTVIDQNPTPLYCSDECRLADLDSRQFYPLDYNPLRDVARDHCVSPTLPPVPHNSLSNSLSCSSDETDSSEASSSPPDALDAPDYVSASYESMSPAIASLAKFYNFPPLPPRPSCIEAEAAEQPREEPKPRRTLEETYSSGIMMAAERIKEKMCTPRSIKPGRSSLSQPAVERKVVPGWTDGSSHWRADVYSLASPNDSVIRDLTKPDDCPRAYQSFTASPHRSIGGVYSTVSDATPTSPSPTRSTTADDVAYYPLTFVRRTDSRSSMHARSLPATTRPLVKKGAEGMLLVPNVELPVRSPSSYAGSESGSASGKSWRSGSKRNVARSPLGRSPSDMTASAEGTVRSSERKVAPAVRRPVVETRSWSYDNVRTYDVMPMPTPTKKETRYETRIVDGKEVRVETVVEVPCERQRLFLFPGKEVIRA